MINNQAFNRACTGISTPRLHYCTQVTAPRRKRRGFHFLGRYCRIGRLTLASMGRNDVSRRL